MIFTRADDSILQAGIDRYRDKTIPFYGYIQQPHYQFPTEPNDVGDEKDYVFGEGERPLIIGLQTVNELHPIVKDVIYNIKAVRFKDDGVPMVRVLPIDELIHLSARGINWEVVTEVQSPNTGIPAFMESMLLSYTMADHYRADGQNEKSIVEERKGDEQMQDALDRFERLEGQNRVPVVTYPPRSLGITRVTTHRNV